ncbi:hypothetical protein GBAR_LOCUS12958 [Geodia barretti]|uniref:Uncharacterized protein n=1 Tax=Geodia barretti TaxID=519541 RepID=A0AA35S236_GEOBA|nr:hypothetical protein GBAR_LOCUS12958 [Geodia barretti]
MITVELVSPAQQSLQIGISVIKGLPLLVYVMEHQLVHSTLQSSAVGTRVALIMQTPLGPALAVLMLEVL